MSLRALARREVRIGRLRGRLPVLITAVLGVALLAGAVVSTVAASREAAQADLDHTLTSQAASDADALKEYFDRAQSIDLLLAHDSAFQQFEPGRKLAPRKVQAASVQAAKAMAYLEQLYPGRISEACLIDNTGTELARVVRGKVAPSSELSTKEAANPFFAPTLRLPRGEVYQAAPYVSQDTFQWVIANSTPMLTASGRAWAMVHFEVSLESFRPSTDEARRRGFSALIVDTRTGRILLDSDRPVGGGKLGRAGSKQLQALVSTPGVAASSATVDGRRVAVAHVPVQKHNANSWSVVVVAPPQAISWSRSIGPAPVATALAALLLLGFAGFNLRNNHRELKTASQYDQLTRLPNRRLMTERLNQALLLARRRGTTCAVLLIDLDRFKEVNDTFGHHHGDQLLRSVADRLREVSRSSDTVARLGGDEFAVLLPDVADEGAALVLAGRCLSALHTAFDVEGVALNVEASIGLALSPQHGADGQTLLRAADVAMYKSKERKSGIVVYSADLDVDTPTRLAVMGDLRRALQDGELFMHYQPKVTLSTQEVHSVEALVRWQHPTRGVVQPAEFIAMAEGTGLILPLTMHTLDLAVAQAKLWLDRGGEIQVAVNLSARCLLELNLPSLVHGVLDRHGLPARLLKLEITESTFMAEPARALTILHDLQQSGVALSIDDFGTGYASMSYLKRLPVDELKVDRSFISHLMDNGSDSVLVRSSIDLGHNLGLSLVAEGVEDLPTITELIALGCDVAQGYYLSRPVSAEAFDQWRADWRGIPGLPTPHTTDSPPTHPNRVAR